MSSPPVITLGARDQRFTHFLRGLFARAQLDPTHQTLLLKHHKTFAHAFTHPLADSTANYEAFEFMGDATVNKCIVWSLVRRFPFLREQYGVKVLARLKINLVSQRVFASIAERCHFAQFITAPKDEFVRHREKIMEDVFEAFFGCTEFLLDEHVRLGAGHDACYALIDVLLREESISLHYKDLFDSKTRLKELCDCFRDTLGKITYTATTVQGEDRCAYKVLVVRTAPSGTHTELAHATHPLKIEAEKEAAEIALTALAHEGFAKEIPKYYAVIEKKFQEAIIKELV